MFTRSHVDAVISKLKKNGFFFVSEAQLQTTFAFEAHNLFKDNFDYILEHPYTTSSGKKDEFDLLIVDKTNGDKTVIEFKHKTIATGSTLLTYGGVEFSPKNHNAQDLGRFDCWSDIQRTEELKLNGEIKNGFFILVTNDHLYWDKVGRKVSGGAFDLSPKTYPPTVKRWARITTSINPGRQRPLDIKQPYEIKYDPFLSEPCKNGDFKILVVEI